MHHPMFNISHVVVLEWDIHISETGRSMVQHLSTSLCVYISQI